MSLAEKTEFPFFDFPVFRYSPLEQWKGQQSYLICKVPARRKLIFAQCICKEKNPVLFRVPPAMLLSVPPPAKRMRIALWIYQKPESSVLLSPTAAPANSEKDNKLFLFARHLRKENKEKNPVLFQNPVLFRAPRACNQERLVSVKAERHPHHVKLSGLPIRSCQGGIGSAQQGWGGGSCGGGVYHD